MTAILTAEVVFPHRPTLREVQAAYVGVVLERHAGDKRAAAVELGVSLKTIYNYLSRSKEGVADLDRRGAAGCAKGEGGS